MELKLNRFLHLPDRSRLWIHGFKDPLSGPQQSILSESLNRFLPAWKTHGLPVQGAFDLVEDRFLILSGYCPEGISGCSIDSYVRVLREVRDEAGMDALNGGLIFFRTDENEIRAVDHLAFYEVAASGVITEETTVFDTLVPDLGTLRNEGMERRFRDSWHARSYPLPSTAPPRSDSRAGIRGSSAGFDTNRSRR